MKARGGELCPRRPRASAHSVCPDAYLTGAGHFFRERARNAWMVTTTTCFCHIWCLGESAVCQDFCGWPRQGQVHGVCLWTLILTLKAVGTTEMRLWVVLGSGPYLWVQSTPPRILHPAQFPLGPALVDLCHLPLPKVSGGLAPFFLAGSSSGAGTRTALDWVDAAQSGGPILCPRACQPVGAAGVFEASILRWGHSHIGLSEALRVCHMSLLCCFPSVWC